MKQCFTLLLLLISLSCFAQKNFVENGKLNGVLPLDDSENVTYQIIKSVDGVSKDELYKRGRKWFVKTYNSAKDVLQVNDPNTGELTGHGYLDGKAKIARVWFSSPIAHTLMVEVKDNRYRITLTDLKLGENQNKLKDFKLPYIGTTENHYTSLYKSIDERAQTLLSSLEKALTTPDDF